MRDGPRRCVTIIFFNVEKAEPPPTAPISHQKEEYLKAEKFISSYSYPEILINLGESDLS